MEKETFNGDAKVKETLSRALRMRVSNQDAKEDGSFTDNVTRAIGKIHKLY